MDDWQKVKWLYRLDRLGTALAWTAAAIGAAFVCVSAFNGRWWVALVWALLTTASVVVARWHIPLIKIGDGE
jgi:CHASE2 domain-containing sensor protein